MVSFEAIFDLTLKMEPFGEIFKLSTNNIGV